MPLGVLSMEGLQHRNRQFLAFYSFVLLLRCSAIFFIAGVLYRSRLERVDNLGAYRISWETGILIPVDYNS
jgi:hypothetical protein